MLLICPLRQIPAGHLARIDVGWTSLLGWFMLEAFETNSYSHVHAILFVWPVLLPSNRIAHTSFARVTNQCLVVLITQPVGSYRRRSGFVHNSIHRRSSLQNFISGVITRRSQKLHITCHLATFRVFCLLMNEILFISMPFNDVSNTYFRYSLFFIALLVTTIHVQSPCLFIYEMVWGDDEAHCDIFFYSHFVRFLCL